MFGQDMLVRVVWMIQVVDDHAQLMKPHQCYMATGILEWFKMLNQMKRLTP